MIPNATSTSVQVKTGTFPGGWNLRGWNLMKREKAKLNPRDRPCVTCPYRKDVEPGIWHPEEYKKLAAYDLETGQQPIGVFQCHQKHITGKAEICRGWFDAIDRQNSLALRIAAFSRLIDPRIVGLKKSPVPVFSSGREAAEHGTLPPEEMSDEAWEQAEKIRKARIKNGRKFSD